MIRLFSLHQNLSLMGSYPVVYNPLQVPDRPIVRHTPFWVVPTVTPDQAAAEIFNTNRNRSWYGDPLTGITFSCDCTVMIWDTPVTPYNYFVRVRHPSFGLLCITPIDSLFDRDLPYHVSAGYLSKKQARRLQSLLFAHSFILTIQISKWSTSWRKSGYVLSGGTLLSVMNRAFGEFGRAPPLHRFHISF